MDTSFFCIGRSDTAEGGDLDLDLARTGVCETGIFTHEDDAAGIAPSDFWTGARLGAGARLGTLAVGLALGAIAGIPESVEEDDAASGRRDVDLLGCILGRCIISLTDTDLGLSFCCGPAV